MQKPSKAGYNPCHFSSFPSSSSLDPNASYTLEGGQLQITSHSGCTYLLPVPSQLQSVHALCEGLLLCMANPPNFSYYHLSEHPYNALQHIITSQSYLDYLSPAVPLLIFYHPNTKSHTFYFAKKHFSEQHFSQKIFLDNYQESLDPMKVGQAEQGFILEKGYEEYQRDEQISEGIEILGQNVGEIVLGVRMGGYGKIYSISLGTEGGGWGEQGVKIVKVIEGVISVWKASLYEMEKGTQTRMVSYRKKVMKREISRCVDWRGMLGRLQQGCLVFGFQNGRSEVFCGKQRILEYRHRILAEVTNQIKRIQVEGMVFILDGIANVSFENSEEEILVQASPKIHHPFISNVLECIKEVVPELYQNMVVDTLKNCIHQNDFIFKDQYNQVTKEDNEFHNFLYYIIYILKFCKRNGFHSNKDYQYSPVIEKKSMKIPKQQIQQTPENQMMQIVQQNQSFASSVEFLKSCDIQMIPPQPIQADYKLPQITLSLEKFNDNKIKIFRILHLLYQDLKLDNLQKQYRQELAYLQFCFSQVSYFIFSTNFQYLDHEYQIVYQDYYVREDSKILNRFQNDTRIKQIEKSLEENQFEIKIQDTSFLMNIHRDQYLEKNPPDIYLWLEESVKHQLVQKMPISFKLSKTLCKFINILYQQDGIVISDLILDKSNFTISQITKELGKDAHLPLFTMINKKVKHKEQLQNSQERAFYYLLKKKIDLQKILDFPYSFQVIIYELLRRLRNDIPSFLLDSQLQKEAFELINRKDMLKNLHIDQDASSNDLKQTIQNIIHGSMDQDDLKSIKQNLTKMNDNLVIREISRLLDFKHDMKVKSKSLNEIHDERYDQECQVQLYNHCIRRLSCFVGHGAFQFGAQTTFITEQMNIPKINLSAILPPDNLKLTLDLKDERYLNNNNWPSFNNGVATALQSSKSFNFVHSSHLRTWILYQRPEQPSYEHGGFLLGMGLLGHLNPFLPTDIYLYLKQNHEATSVGVLLGLACSRIGKVDDGTYKTFCLHIHYLLPQNYDVEIPLVVQTAALIGIGLLYKSSSNRLMSEMTLAQIGAKPLDKPQDRESYSLAAGFSLGLINLSKGANSPSIKDLNLTQRLLSLIHGGPSLPPPKSMLSSHFPQAHSHSSILEHGINVHVTSSGALLALCLIHFNSNNEGLISQIQMPLNRHLYMHNYFDNITLKAICRALISWNSIGKDRSWVDAQIAPWASQMRGKGEQIEKVYWGWIVGVVLALALKWAGTGDREVVEVITTVIKELRDLKVVSLDKLDLPNQGNCIDQHTSFQCLAQLSLALGLVHAGSCDIHSIKLCRVIRKKIQDSGHYGFNMAVNMALGFLCLGNGSHSFSRSDFSIACLLISIYPYFPHSPQDNKEHLQALRNFYILAIEQREVRTINTVSNQEVNISIDLQSEHEVKNVITPVLIQDQKKLQYSIFVKVVRIKDSHYYNLELPIHKLNFSKNRIIYVQEKPQICEQTIKQLVQESIISEADTETYKLLLQEDRYELFDFFLILKQDLDRQQLQDIKILSHYFKEQHSKIFNHYFLQDILNTYEYQEEYKPYFKDLSIQAQLLKNINLGNLFKKDSFFKWMAIHNIPDKSDLSQIQKFYTHLQTQQSTKDVIENFASLSLNVSFPNISIQGIEQLNSLFMQG